MIAPTEQMPWYIEQRSKADPEKVSLDLTWHLPRRSMAGSIVIICNKPNVLLPVIRKRWMKVLREVERQYSSTLDRSKKASLKLEIIHMKSRTFAINSATFMPRVDILFTESLCLCQSQSYRTLYILTPLTPTQLKQHTALLMPGGLIVDYGFLENAKTK